MLAFPMAAEIVASNPRVEENLGRVAVQRGPIVYCMEGLDQNAAAADFSEVAIVVNPKSLKAFEVEHKPALLEGVTVLKHSGAIHESASDKGPLYADANGCGAEDSGGEFDADSVLRLGESEADGDAGLDSVYTAVKVRFRL